MFLLIPLQMVGFFFDGTNLFSNHISFSCNFTLVHSGSKFKSFKFLSSAFPSHSPYKFGKKQPAVSMPQTECQSLEISFMKSINPLSLNLVSCKVAGHGQNVEKISARV